MIPVLQFAFWRLCHRLGVLRRLAVSGVPVFEDGFEVAFAQHGAEGFDGAVVVDVELSFFGAFVAVAAAITRGEDPDQSLEKAAKQIQSVLGSCLRRKQ